eukprot:6470854-Amphidinium_carterae.1
MAITPTMAPGPESEPPMTAFRPGHRAWHGASFCPCNSVKVQHSLSLLALARLHFTRHCFLHHCSLEGPPPAGGALISGCI